jgi:myosin heavy subunit
MKNLKAGFIAAVLIALAVLFYLQHQVQEKLHVENAALAQQLVQLQTDNESLSNQLAAAGDAKSLSDKEHNELLKLRGEVGVLRRKTNELGKLQDERQRLQRQTTVGQNQTTELSPEDRYQLNQWHTVNALKQLGLAMVLYANDNNNQYATNFDQLKNVLGGVTNFTGNIGLDKFEFVNAGLVNGSMPDKIIFREQTPRQNPQRGWERVYGLADGSVYTQYSEDGNFDAFEKQHMVSPP